jgi:hypothetical protein
MGMGLMLDGYDASVANEIQIILQRDITKGAVLMEGRF